MTIVSNESPPQSEAMVDDHGPWDATGTLPAPPPKRQHPLRKRFISEGFLVVLITTGIYLTAGSLLAFKYGSFNADAVSRMANGFYVLYSRDPHLAAIGFVWQPLQSILDAVFLIGNHLWPALSHRDMAGTFVSVFGMVGAVHQVRSALREWGVRRSPRLVLTLLFAIDPMIVYYGGNGMSEGLYLFTLVAAARYLLRWIHTESLRSLAYAGVFLGLCYLTRNEAAGAAVAGAVVVVLISFFRQSSTSRWRTSNALHDGVIFFLPPFVAAAGWAITSRIIVGEFFPQFTSIYGNSSQEAFLTHKHLSARLTYEIHAMFSLAPLFILILVVAIVLAIRRRDAGVLGPISVVGGALAFDAFAYLHNNIESFYRYYITIIPLDVLVLGSLFAAGPAIHAVRNNADAEPEVSVPKKRRPFGALLACIISLIVLVPAMITTGAAMFNSNTAPQESALLGPIFHSQSHWTAADKVYAGGYQAVVVDANDISRLHLPNGSIVLDNFTSCAPNIITTISTPTVFVIPNDRDFKKILFDPIAFHADYILEANPDGSPITATNIQYPTLWSTGAGFTKLFMQIPARAYCPEFRLFHVIHHTNNPAG